MQRRKPDSRAVTKGELRLLAAAALLLGAVILKTSGASWAQELRQKTVSALAGGIPAEQVLAVAGQTLETGDLLTVFAGLHTQTDPVQPEGDAPDRTAVYGGSAFDAQESTDRTSAAFPKTVQNTAYPLEFETAVPVEGVRTSAFGERTHPITGQSKFHYGLDIGAAEGTPIHAFAAGTVRETGQSDSYGNYIILDHTAGFSSLYAHCSRVDAQKGESVTAGQTIAAVGHTGAATGDHLHFELWRDNKALDPAQYL